MLEIVLFVILALVFGFFSTQNTSLVSIHMGQYTFSQIPLYMVLGIALLVGLVVSWLIASIDTIFTILKIRSKENTIKDAKKTIHDLTKKVNQLEIENAKLQGKLEKNPLAEDSL